MCTTTSNRSIPACAGEPATETWTCLTPSVYPRVCGGTPMTRTMAPINGGLSPRVRGNRQACATWRAGGGSIPACAGEPQVARALHLAVEVYPRVCGGTGGSCISSTSPTGLSPRVRGNPLLLWEEANPMRSIPACAGEPLDHRWPRGAVTVYPRVCGGTLPRPRRSRTSSGLSPRVRGNRRGRGFVNRRGRSIPACAGEPSSRAYRHCRCGVYPRVCGGTDVAAAL